MTPAAILAKALEHFDCAELATLAFRSGVPRDVVVRAANGANGQPTRANHYLRICASIGLDPTTGTKGEPWPPADIEARLFAMGVRMARYGKKQDQREAAKVMRISASALSRIENGDLRSFDAMLAACRYARLHSLNYFVPRETTGKQLRAQDNRSAA